MRPGNVDFKPDRDPVLSSSDKELRILIHSLLTSQPGFNRTDLRREYRMTCPPGRVLALLDRLAEAQKLLLEAARTGAFSHEGGLLGRLEFYLNHRTADRNSASQP